MQRISPADYKAAKEAFVTGLNGGSIWEITLMIWVAPAGLWAHGELKVSI